MNSNHSAPISSLTCLRRPPVRLKRHARKPILPQLLGGQPGRCDRQRRYDCRLRIGSKDAAKSRLSSTGMMRRSIPRADQPAAFPRVRQAGPPAAYTLTSRSLRRPSAHSRKLSNGSRAGSPVATHRVPFRTKGGSHQYVGHSRQHLHDCFHRTHSGYPRPHRLFHCPKNHIRPKTRRNHTAVKHTSINSKSPRGENARHLHPEVREGRMDN